MRTCFVAAALLAAAIPAAAEDCFIGSDAVQVSGWSVETTSPNEQVVTLHLASSLPATTRMIDNFAGFRDALGNSVGFFSLPPDTRIPHDQEIVITQSVSGGVLARLPDLKKDEVAAFFCLRGVVYEDGTVEKFD